MNKVSVSNTIVSAKKRRLFVTTTALLAAGAFLPADKAQAVDDHADWDNVQIVEGQGIVTDTGLGSTTIDQHSMRAIGEAQELHIGTMGSVRINQTSKNALFVGRVVGNHSDPTQILGRLSADGRVMIIDRNGVFFGENSIVDAAGIAATTGDVTNLDVMDGNENFTFQNFGSGKIELNGTMNISEAGLAAFVAPNVRNSGVINAKMGKVVFAGGEQVTLDLYGDGLVEVAVDGALGNTLLENKGTIDAEGGTVIMTAESARDVVDNVINNEGVISVGSVTQKGGKIVLSGGAKGKVRNTGTLDASGTEGGSVKVTGQAVELAAASRVKANASVGEAGKIEVIAKETLAVNGKLNAQGEGKTGFIETSAPVVSFGTQTEIRAGKWLLDPADIWVHAPLAGIIEGQLTVGDAEISSALAGPGLGRIYFTDTVDWSSGNNFTVNAYSDIHFRENGGLNATGGGDIVLNAPDDIRIFNGSTGIKTAGGNVTLNTGDEVSILDADGIDAGGGNILIDNQKGFYGLANTLKTTGTGTITLYQAQDKLEEPSGYKTEIQNAINAIHNTGTGANTLYVREGHFSENLTVDLSLNLIGLGYVDLEARDPGEALIKVTASDVTIGPSFSLNGQNRTNYGVVAQGAGTHGLVVDGNSFRNFKTGGVNIKDTSGGNVSIVNNAFDGGLDYGIRTGKLENGTILEIANNDIGSRSNKVDKTGIEIGRVKDSAVTINNDNRIYAREKGISFKQVSGSTVDIDGNKVRSGDDGIKFLGIAGGSEVTVSGNDIKSEKADGIEVESGSSNGTALASSTLTIAGNEIEGKGGFGIKIHKGDLKDGAVINVTGNESIEGEDGGVYVKDKYFGGVFVNVSGNEKIGSDKGHGIALYNVIKSGIYGNVIRDVGKDGIHVEDFGKSWIAYNNISETGDDGIEVRNGEFVSIRNNTIFDIGKNGFLPLFDLFGKKGYGHHDDDGADGIHVANVGGSTPSYYGFGYGAFGADSEIFGNDISVVEDDGIEVVNSNKNYTGHNVIGHVNGDGIAVERTRSTTIVDNTISFALENGIYVNGGDSGYGYNILGLKHGDKGGFGNGVYAGIFGNRILLTGDDGIEVKNIGGDSGYGYGPGLLGFGFPGYGSNGWAVNIDGNEVAMTGRNGIWAHDSESVRVYNNDVFAAGMGENLGGKIRLINAFTAGTPHYLLQASAEDGFKSGRYGWWTPSFTWNWGDGHGIRVNDVYGTGPSGFSVDVQKNLVAGTGGHGIKVHDADSARINYNDVSFAGLDYTTIPGYYSLLGLLSSGPFDDGSGWFGYGGGEEPAFLSLSLFGGGYGDDDGDPVRRDLWASSGQSLADILIGYIPFPDKIGYDSHDGIHVSNVGNDSYLYGKLSGFGFGFEQPFPVVIQGNTVDRTGDDGIEVVSSGRTLIGGFGWREGNAVSNVGYANPYGYGKYGYGYDDGYGADGIHVRDTYGSPSIWSLFSPYDVKIIGNTVDRTADDGVQVLYSGNAFIAGNGLTNIGYLFGGPGDGAPALTAKFGYGDYGYGYGAVDEWGADGIHVLASGGYLPSVARTQGISEIGYFPSENKTTIIFNDIGTVADDGIETEGVNDLLIAYNTVQDTGDDGVNILGYGGYAYETPDDEYEYGLFLAPVYGPQFKAVVHDNTVDDSGGDGIESSGYDTLEVTDNEVSNSDYNGLYVSGFYNGYVSMQDNTFTDNGHVESTEGGDVLVGAGARFESGDIDMSDLTRPNFFVNTTGVKALGMQFDPAEMYGYPDYGYEYAYIYEDSYAPVLANLTIVNETLGSTVFDGYTPEDSFYVRFEDGAILDEFGNVIVIDGTNATWDGILPAATGGVLTPGQLNFIETRLWDADDPLRNGRGQIFVGATPGQAGLDNIQDFFNQFGDGAGRSNGLNVTFLGLPPVGPQSLNDIAPAAGEEGEQNPADIEPAAGEGEGSEQVGCWSDLGNLLSTGKAASINDDGSSESAMDQAANCGAQQQI